LGPGNLMTFGAAAVLAVLLFSNFKREAQQVAEIDEKGLASYRARSPVDEPQAVQKARATQPGRGRLAHSPFAIPWLGWKDILWRIWTGISEDHLLTLAGGVAFFALLALVPALTASVSSYALFADAHAISAAVCRQHACLIRTRAVWRPKTRNSQPQPRSPLPPPRAWLRLG
jgi:hypothetical protein